MLDPPHRLRDAGLRRRASSARELEAETGVPVPWDTEAFADLDLDVRKSIARIRGEPVHPAPRHVRGFVYEVETGVLREVAQDAG